MTRGAEVYHALGAAGGALPHDSKASTPQDGVAWSSGRRAEPHQRPSRSASKPGRERTDEVLINQAGGWAIDVSGGDTGHTTSWQGRPVRRGHREEDDAGGGRGGGRSDGAARAQAKKTRQRSRSCNGRRDDGGVRANYGTRSTRVASTWRGASSCAGAAVDDALRGATAAILGSAVAPAVRKLRMRRLRVLRKFSCHACE